MTTKTVLVRAGDSVAVVKASSGEFLPKASAVGATTGHFITTVASVSWGRGVDSTPVGYRIVSSTLTGANSPTTCGLVVNSLDVKRLNVTVRPQVVERELSTERLNKAIKLGYMPPRRATKSQAR